jgi:hypothetical protein
MIKALSTKPVKMIVLLPTEGELKEALSNIPNCTVYLAPFPAHLFVTKKLQWKKRGVKIH